MNIPPKYEDVVARLDEALSREAALREELDRVCGDEWRKDKRQIAALQQRLTVAEHPAPIAVVMPERKPAEWRGISATFASGWNACLDEVARLNGVKP